MFSLFHICSNSFNIMDKIEYLFVVECLIYLTFNPFCPYGFFTLFDAINLGWYIVYTEGLQVVISS